MGIFNKKEIWQAITSHFSSNLPPKEFETWFSQAGLKTIDDEQAVIKVPNRFFANWFREHYLEGLCNIIKEFSGRYPEILFSLTNAPAETTPTPRSIRAGRLPFPKPDLYPEKTFDNFVRGDTNAFAYFSCLEIAEKNPRSYIPLYLFSEKSCGKTHLLHAVGNRMRDINPDLNVRYIHSDRFTSEFTQSMRTGHLHPFRSLFSELDLLLFDDVHVLSGRSQTQHEFTNALNALLRSGKTVVIAGRSAPFRIDDMTPRLKSILSWGLLVEIQPPDTDTRIQIIREQISKENISIPDDVVFFLAKSNDDTKNLLSNFTRIQAYLSLNKGNISLSDVRNLIRGQGRQGIEIDDIQAVTAGYFKVSVSDLLSNSKRRPVAYARRMAMYLCKKHTENSYKKISSHFSKKDHSTALYAIRRIDEEILNSEKVKEDLRNLEKLIT